MSRIIKLQQKILSFFPLTFFILVVVIWVEYYSIGFSSFNKGNAVTIFASVIGGMSALLSVALAVIIFRIQSLENRSQSLEQSTLNYIYQITGGWTYPQWTSSVEDDIRNKSITNRYYLRIDPIEEEFRKQERDKQQKRLEETLNLHNGIVKRIERIRKGFWTSAIFLIMPILSSLLMLMVSDTFDSSWNFVFVSIVVLMSALGISLLVKIVKESLELSL